MKRLILLFAFLIALPCQAQDLARMGVGWLGGGAAAVGGAMSQETVRPGADVSFTNTGEDYQYWKDTMGGGIDRTCGTVACFSKINDEDTTTTYISHYDGDTANTAVFRFANATGSGTISSIVVYAQTQGSGNGTMQVSISGDAGSSYTSEQALTFTTSSTLRSITFTPASWTDSNVKSNNFYIKIRQIVDGLWGNEQIFEIYAVINPA